jgi:hypothetical protein
MRFFGSALVADEVAGMYQAATRTPWGETQQQAYLNQHPPTLAAVASASIAVTNWEGGLSTWCSGSHSNDDRFVTIILSPHEFAGEVTVRDSSGYVGYHASPLCGNTYRIPWRGNLCDGVITGIWSFTPSLAITNAQPFHFNRSTYPVIVSATPDDNPIIRNANSAGLVNFGISGFPNTPFDGQIAPGSVSHGASILSQGGLGATMTLFPGNVATNYNGRFRVCGGICDYFA